MLKDNEIPISSLNRDELRAAIEKQKYLIHSFGTKLPDGGARLKIYLDKLKSELDNRSEISHVTLKCSPATLDKLSAKPPNGALGSTNRSISGVSNQSEANDVDDHHHNDNNEPDVQTLTEQLSTLVIERDGSNSDEKSENSKEDLSSIPDISLNEVLRLRLLLNLPTLVLSSFRWFVFVLRPIGDLVYLTVVDCANPDRHFVRIGLRSTWFPGIQFNQNAISTVNQTGDSKRPSHVTQPAEALRDFWKFICNPSSSIDPVPDTSVPCLICRSTPNQDSGDSVNDLIWFSRLLRNTRHYNMSRTWMPRDCRFIDTRSLKLDSLCTQSVVDHGHSGSKPDQLVTDQILNGLRSLRAAIFCTDVKGSSQCTTLKFRHHSSAHEFLNAAITRSLPWMEASLEFEFLRELKASSTLSERLRCSMGLRPRAVSSSSNGTTTRGLQHVPDPILRRLASLGLGRTRLTRLAGMAGWHGFAGLLAFRSNRSSDQQVTETQNEKRVTPVFVTDDLQVLQDLYAFFQHIYSRMHRHDMYYREGKNRREVASPRVQLPVSTSPVIDAPAKVHAWIAGGNSLLDPNAQRQPRVLSMDESIELMQRAQKAFQEARMKRNLPTYPSLPPDSEKLYRYRDIRRDSECETGGSEEEEDESEGAEDDSDTNASSASEVSLGLEDVD